MMIWSLSFADDCSDDGSLELLRAESVQDFRIKIMKIKKNCGPAIRVNQAAKVAR